MNNYTVYKHISPSGKVYIGITQQEPEARWKNGGGYLNKNKFGNYGQPAMANAIFKYGWENFKHEILYVHLTKEESEQKEMELIAYYKSDNEKYGYNINRGGNHTLKSEETKKKMSECKKGSKNAMYGKPSHRRKKVRCIDTNIIYDSMSEAARQIGVDRTAISNCCRGETQTAGKLHWEYWNDDKLIA